MAEGTLFSCPSGSQHFRLAPPQPDPLASAPGLPLASCMQKPSSHCPGSPPCAPPPPPPGGTNRVAPLLLPHPTPCSRQEPGDLLHPHPGGGAERCRPARRLWKAGRQSQMAPPDVTRLPQGRQLGAAGGARKVEPVMPGHPLLIPALLVRRSSPPPPLATSGRQWTPRHECLGGRSISRTRHDVHAWCVAGLCWCSTQKPKKPGPSVPKLKIWVSPLCSYLHPRCSMHCALHLHDVPPHLFPSQLSPDPVLRLFR